MDGRLGRNTLTLLSWIFFLRILRDDKRTTCSSGESSPCCVVSSKRASDVCKVIGCEYCVVARLGRRSNVARVQMGERRDWEWDLQALIRRTSLIGDVNARLLDRCAANSLACRPLTELDRRRSSRSRDRRERRIMDWNMMAWCILDTLLGEGWSVCRFVRVAVSVEEESLAQRLAVVLGRRVLVRS